MLENDESAYHFKYFQNIPILESRDRTNPPTPDLPTLKAYPTPGEGGRFDFFFRHAEGKGWT